MPFARDLCTKLLASPSFSEKIVLFYLCDEGLLFNNDGAHFWQEESLVLFLWQVVNDFDEFFWLALR